MEFSHISVLLNESIDSLDIKPDGIYLDATAGGGGHSAVILSKLSSKGRLICVDRDPDAIKVLKARFGDDERVIIVNRNYSEICDILQSLGISKVDGILADLGVSSFQLDTAERGFSFHNDAPLDMRMSKEGMTAADAVNTLSEAELSNIIFKYGEEKFARRIAKEIVTARQHKPIETTFELVDIVKAAIPAAARRTGGHPCRRTFQALRIFINEEISRLASSVTDMFDCLNVEGRLSIITFHSLEDRTVKQTFASLCEGCTCPPDFPVCVCGNKQKAKLVFKSVAPSDAEIEENPRSRSARLRCLCRTAE